MQSLALESLVGPGDLILGNNVPCGNTDSAIAFSTAIPIQLWDQHSALCSAPGEPERRLRNRGWVFTFLLGIYTGSLALS